MTLKSIADTIRSYNKKGYVIPFLLSLVLAVVPFIFRLHYVKIDVHSLFYKAFPSHRTSYEVFHYYKGVAIIFLCYLMLYFFMRRYQIKSNALTKFCFIFITLILASTFFSEFQSYSFSGGAFSFQGVFVWVSYVLLAFFASTVNLKFVKYLVGAALFSGFLMSILGLIEFYGVDIRKEVFNILPVFHSDIHLSYAQHTSTIDTLFYNPNYYGVFLGVLSILSVVLFLFARNRKQMIIFGCIYAVLFFNLIGSGSKTGFYTLLFSFFLMMIFLRRKLKSIIVKNVILSIISIGIILGIYSGSVINKLAGVIVNQIRILNNISSPTGKIGGGTLKRVSVKKNILTIEPYNNKPLYVKMNDDSTLSFSSSKKFKSSLEINSRKTEYQALVNEMKNKGISDIEIKNDENVKNLELSKNLFDVYTFSEKEYAYIKIYQRENDKAIFDFVIMHKNNLDYVKIPIVLGPKTFYTLGFGDKPAPIIDAPKIEFLNKRNMLFTHRGMLWSLSIPLLAKVPFLGYGADAFPLAYPNNDYISRYKTYGNLTASQLAASHSLYTQIGVEFGLLFLLLFIAFNIYFLFRTAKKLWFANFDTFNDFALLSCFLMVFFYLSASVLNSSMVSVSPLYWVFIGIGFALQGVCVNKKTID